MRWADGANDARPVRGPKGGWLVRATSGQRGDHTGGTMCRVTDDTKKRTHTMGVRTEERIVVVINE